MQAQHWAIFCVFGFVSWYFWHSAVSTPAVELAFFADELSTSADLVYKPGSPLWKVPSVRKLAFVALAIVLASCSSTPSREDQARDAAKADLVRAKAQEARVERLRKDSLADLAEVPPWVLDIPKPDDRGVYAVGTSRSDDLTLVVRKAMLDAQFGLAKQVQQELSGTETTVRTESGGRRGNEVYQSAATTLVARVPVVGYEILRNEVKVLPSGQYAAYVMLLLPTEQITRALAQQRAETADSTIQRALAELDRRIKERQESRTPRDVERAPAAAASSASSANLSADATSTSR